MTRDFTLEKYEKLAQALKQNYRVMGVGDYLSLPKGGEFIAVVRHDVDGVRGTAHESSFRYGASSAYMII